MIGYDGNDHNTDNSSNSKTYYYSVESEPTPSKKKNNNKKTAALAILIVVCMLLSSIATSCAMMRFYDENQDGAQNGVNIDGGYINNGSGYVSGVDDTIIINKVESGDKPVIDGNIGDEGMNVAQVTQLVADSVVEITTSSVKYNFYYGQYVESGAGSGVIIGRSDKDSAVYYVVTNHHVIDGAETIKISLRNGTELEGNLIGTDMISDIAVIQIKSSIPLTAATLGNGENSVVGEEVVVIGNPLGQLGGTVTNGIISALEREVNVGGMKMALMQTNAAISPGNSGGGMFNMAGELIGVINAKYSSDNAEGLGFAIPVDYAYEIITELLKQGYVSGRAALPLFYQEYLYNTSIMGNTSCCLIITADNDTYGIKANDMIYTIDGNQVTTETELLSLLSNYSVGDTVELNIARTEGRTSKIYSYKVTLTEQVPDTK